MFVVVVDAKAGEENIKPEAIKEEATSEETIKNQMKVTNQRGDTYEVVSEKSVTKEVVKTEDTFKIVLDSPVASTSLEDIDSNVQKKLSSREGRPFTLCKAIYSFSVNVY